MKTSPWLEHNLNFFLSTTSLEKGAVYNNLENESIKFYRRYILDKTSWNSNSAIYDVTQMNFLERQNYDVENLDNFFELLEDRSNLINLDNTVSVYHYSIPNTKLYYPEPYIASPSFMHTDMWYVHILVYQYWLWFMFGVLITIFFCLFLITLRWCNIRIRPKRETRGVSRAKCGDLITACVPVSWATSIIVTETTDAMDYFDGAGTTEFVVGIRAYQWGWEYYYPKDIDLNYNVNNNYSVFLGNSLKYNPTTSTNLTVNNFWKYYQNKNTDSVITPSHLLLLPNDSNNIINKFLLSDFGYNTKDEPVAFKNTKMSSKFFTNDLINLPFNNTNKSSIINKLTISEEQFLSSYLFGLKRQHNFLNNQSALNNSSTFFDLNSLKNLYEYNWNSNKNTHNTTHNGFSNLFFNDPNTLTKSRFGSLLQTINNSKQILDGQNTEYFSFFRNLLTLFNNDSDKKKFIDTLSKTNSLHNMSYNFENKVLLSAVQSEGDFNSIDGSYINNFFNNYNNNYQFNETFSTNRVILSSEQNIQNFLNLHPKDINFNSSPYSSEMESDFVNNQYNFNKLSETGYSAKDLAGSTNTLNNLKLSASSIYFPLSKSPILSNKKNLSWLNYDQPSDILNDNSTALILQNDLKDNSIPTALSSIYWETFFSNSSKHLRLNDLTTISATEAQFYLPFFTEYYDYDFRNLQAIQLYEDSYWDATYSPYIYDEYLSLKYNFVRPHYFSKIDGYFEFLIGKTSKINKNELIDINTTDSDNLNDAVYPTVFYLEDSNQSTQLTSQNHLINVAFSSLINPFEDSYESLKYLNQLYNLEDKFFFTNSSFFIQPHTHSYVANLSRSNYDDFSWYSNSMPSNIESADANSIQQLIGSEYIEDLDSLNNDWLSNTLNESDEYNKSSNLISIRPYTKNSMVNYNAMQKVFRSRFEEGRSFVKLKDIALSESKQPFLNSNKVAFERSIGKEKINFYKINFYKNNNLNYYNNFYSSFSSLNFYFFDFPFLLSGKSDPSRYLWFDWYAKWGELAVQPSSSAKYAIHGMPYFNKIFEYTNTNNDLMNETENYLNRITKARKSYLAGWSYAPYLTFRNSNSYTISNENSTLLNGNKLKTAKGILTNFNYYWYERSSRLDLIDNFSVGFSNISSYGKIAVQPSVSTQSYFYNLNSLADIFTKREFLYREFFLKNNKIETLPLFVCASPKNDLYQELKSSFLYLNSIDGEIEENYQFLNNLNNFNRTTNTTLIKYLELHFNSDYFLGFLKGSVTNLLDNSYEPKGNSNILLKNQYRPIKKGISNMIKLHATGAIALPVEMRIQILASSKDVIHSWAIPSAGVKIDCVPGYSSHRITIFLSTGIFWGQCMEVCGRYHHWMPIVIYFMKRDLFFLWCTHFIFLNDSTKNWVINDRQGLDYLKPVSFSQLDWFSELLL